MNALAAGSDLCTYYDRRLAPRWRRVPYNLRMTEWKDLPVPVFVVKERQGLSQVEHSFQLALPLDEEAGAKLALILRLQERVPDLDRVELIARRVARFTREEAAYWLSRTTSVGADANRWALSGLRVMLGGQAKDPAVQRMLERLRHAG